MHTNQTVKHGEWVLVDANTDEPVKNNTVRLDFRGDPLVVKGGTPPRHSGSTGRVHTNQGEFYPSVIDCKWVM